MRSLPPVHLLAEALTNAGYELPKECVNVELSAPIADVIQIRFTCNITSEDLVKIADALKWMGEQR